MIYWKTSTSSLELKRKTRGKKTREGFEPMISTKKVKSLNHYAVSHVFICTSRYLSWIVDSNYRDKNVPTEVGKSRHNFYFQTHVYTPDPNIISKNEMGLQDGKLQCLSFSRLFFRLVLNTKDTEVSRPATPSRFSIWCKDPVCIHVFENKSCAVTHSHWWTPTTGTKNAVLLGLQPHGRWKYRSPIKSQEFKHNEL